MLNGLDISRVAVEAVVSAPAVRRVYLGFGNDYNRRRVIAAAKKLGVGATPTRAEIGGK